MFLVFTFVRNGNQDVINLHETKIVTTNILVREHLGSVSSILQAKGYADEFIEYK